MIDAPFEHYERLLADDEEAALRVEHAKKLKAWTDYRAILEQQRAKIGVAHLLRERGIR